MSQNNSLSSVNKTSLLSFDDDVDENNVISTIENNEILSSNSPDALNNSNDDWKSVDDNNDIDINRIQDDLTIVNNNGWANFDTFENNTNQNSETIPVTTLNTTEDDWADFEANTIQSTEHSIQLSNEKQSEKINKDDDAFGDYGEVQVSPKFQISSLSINCLSTEQIDSLISTCFPSEPSTLSTDIDNFIPCELPSFTTCKDQIKQLPCFKYSLSLWNVLSNVSNDPIGIQYQWRKSNTERFFHQALGVHERLRTKIIPLISEISSSEVQTTVSNVNNENGLSPQIVGPSVPENPLTDIDSSSLSANSDKIDDNVLDTNKTLDLDSYIPSIQTSTLNREEQITSSIIIYRNNSPILQQHSTPIKTIDLYPGSTTVLNDDVKPVIDSVSNFSFMNPKALMFPTNINTESATLS